MVHRNIIMVDFDETLTKGGQFWTDDIILPNQKMIDWVNQQYREKNVIIIYTARPYETMRETVAWLIKHGVKYHGINMDKPKAQIYVDDRALHPDSISDIKEHRCIICGEVACEEKPCKCVEDKK